MYFANVNAHAGDVADQSWLDGKSVNTWPVDTALGPDFARWLARKTPSRNDIWHLDELVVSIVGDRHWQWTAVYQNGNMLEEIVQVRRNARVRTHNQ
nr:DDE-type integrase/transposase/recombinase [Mesorhizobium tianshanense]